MKYPEQLAEGGFGRYRRKKEGHAQKGQRGKAEVAKDRWREKRRKRQVKGRAVFL